MQARALGQPLTREVLTNGRSSELTESIRLKLRNDLATVRTGELVASTGRILRIS